MRAQYRRPLRVIAEGGTCTVLVEEVQIGADPIPLAIFHAGASAAATGTLAAWHPGSLWGRPGAVRAAHGDSPRPPASLCCFHLSTHFRELTLAAEPVLLESWSE